MKNIHGWVGKILRIDLTTGKITKIDTEKYTRYIGGLGIGAKLAWEELAPNTRAFDPENKLFFMTGPLGGIPMVPGAGRGSLSGVSPHVHPKECFTYSNMGGDWPTELKFSGYDGIIVQGRSDKPVYIQIIDGSVEIKSAKNLWGLNTYDTQKTIIDKIGDKNVRTLCIGPAGENKVRFAAIISDTGSAHGQGGFGAVMGSKNLKAITVKGSGHVSVADPEKLMNTVKYANKIIWGISTPGCFEEQVGPEGKLWGLNSGIALAKEGYGKHSDACRGCARACRGFFTVPGASIKSGQGMCVQWFYGIARDPKNDGTTIGDEATWMAKTLADSLGINVVEISGMLFWLRDALEENIISEKDHPVPKFLGGTTDDLEFLTTLMEGIAYRKGFGDVLAEGTARAAETLGKKAWSLYERYFMSHGMHTHWCDSVLGCLQWAVDSRDPFANGHDYLYGVNNPAAAKFAWGSEEAADPKSYEHVPKTLSIIQKNRMYKDMLPLCDFAFPVISTPFTENKLGDMELPLKIFEPTTGVDLKEKGLKNSAEIVVNLLRAIAVREGRTREDDNVYPSKFNDKFFKNGMARMFKMFGPLDKKKWEKMKTEYYVEMGWDTKTGWPTKKKLLELGLKEVAKELKKLGKLA